MRPVPFSSFQSVGYCADTLAAQYFGIFIASHGVQTLDELLHGLRTALALWRGLEIGRVITAGHIVIALVVIGFAQPVLGKVALVARRIATVQVLLESGNGVIEVACLEQCIGLAVAAVCGRDGSALASGAALLVST